MAIVRPILVALVMLGCSDAPPPDSTPRGVWVERPGAWTEFEAFHAYTSLDDAMRAVEPGDSVLMAPGRYIARAPLLSPGEGILIYNRALPAEQIEALARRFDYSALRPRWCAYVDAVTNAPIDTWPARANGACWLSDKYRWRGVHD